VAKKPGAEVPGTRKMTAGFYRACAVERLSVASIALAVPIFENCANIVRCVDYGGAIRSITGHLLHNKFAYEPVCLAMWIYSALMMQIDACFVLILNMFWCCGVKEIS
jgi:hypothetical protein